MALLMFKLKGHVCSSGLSMGPILKSLLCNSRIFAQLLKFQQLMSSTALECALFMWRLEISQELKGSFIKTFWGALSLCFFLLWYPVSLKPIVIYIPSIDPFIFFMTILWFYILYINIQICKYKYKNIYN